MNKIYRYIVFGLILNLGFSCSETSINPEPEFDNPCTSDIQITDTISNFSAEINGTPWIPNNGSFASIYKSVLSINAGDSLSHNGDKNIINIDISNPISDYNYVSWSTGNKLMLHHFKEGSNYLGFANCGFIKIEKLDTINGFVSGYFHGTLNDEARNMHIDISNGVFNLPINSVFCEVSFVEKSVSIDLFNNWKLIGFFDNQGLLISHPPCNSSPSIRFTKEFDNTILKYKVDGFGTSNTFEANLELLDNSKLLFSDFFITKVGGSIHQMDFEEEYIGLFLNSELQYSIYGNILKLKNIKEEVIMKFVLM